MGLAGDQAGAKPKAEGIGPIGAGGGGGATAKASVGVVLDELGEERWMVLRWCSASGVRLSLSLSRPV